MQSLSPAVISAADPRRIIAGVERASAPAGIACCRPRSGLADLLRQAADHGGIAAAEAAVFLPRLRLAAERGKLDDEAGTGGLLLLRLGGGLLRRGARCLGSGRGLGERLNGRHLLHRLAGRFRGRV